MKDENIPNLINDEKFKIAFLYWLVQGSIKFFQRKIKIPQSVKDDVNEYRISQDPIQRFISECCKLDPVGSTNATDLYNSYISWKPKDVQNITQTKFGLHLTNNLKYKKNKNSYGYTVYQGISLTNILEL